jgi:WD40 repeat protein
MAGNQIVTSSADQTARIWDTRSGENTLTLAGHTHYVYKACFDGDGEYVATCGADKIVNYWDLRNPAKPVFTNGDIKNVLLCCDFMPNSQ